VQIIDFGGGLNLFIINVLCYLLFVLVRRHIDIWLPDQSFDPTRRRYRLAQWEHNGFTYRRWLHINAWKDKLPCFKPLTGFSKKTLVGSQHDYLQQFIIETCRAESNHVSAIIFVFVMQLWTPFNLWLTCFAIATIGNAPFIFIQRYNRPRLQRALAMADAEAQRSHFETDSPLASLA
jgi:glycosyl-4,4'-diaponeurosporenoate acyltransferase